MLCRPFVAHKKKSAAIIYQSALVYYFINFKMRDCDTRFNFKDLINYTDNLGLKIAIIDENEKVLETFDKEDIKKTTHKSSSKI